MKTIKRRQSSWRVVLKGTVFSSTTGDEWDPQKVSPTSDKETVAEGVLVSAHCARPS